MLLLALVVVYYQSFQKPEGPPDGEYHKNAYLITLNNGHYTFRDWEEGIYEVDGDKITFHIMNFKDPTYCAEFTNYTYRWTFDAGNNQLIFEPVDDPCTGRRDVHTLGKWSYKPLSQ